MDLQRANHWAGIGSFFVAVLALAVLLYDRPQRPETDTPLPQQEFNRTWIGRIPTDELMEWLPIGLIVGAILAGGYMHLRAAQIQAQGKPAGINTTDAGIQGVTVKRVDERKDDPVGSAEKTLPKAESEKAEPPRQGAGLRIDQPLLNQSAHSLAGEIDWKPRLKGTDIVIEVKNVNPTGPPKSGIIVWVEDLRKWSDQNAVFVKVRAFEDAPKPGNLRLAQGHSNLYFDEFQRYVLLPVADSTGVMRLHYFAKKQHHPIVMEAGTWRSRIKVDWNGRSETRDVCFRSEGPKKTPVLVECPTER